jgi:hypothetical protein
VLNPRRRPWRPLLAVVALCALYGLARAQEPPPSPSTAHLTPPPSLRQALERSDHDPARRGPLLVVLPPDHPMIPQPPPRPVTDRTLAAIAEAYGRRVQKAGGITTLAPAIMTVIISIRALPVPWPTCRRMRPRRLPSTRSMPRSGRRSRARASASAT